MVPRRLFTGGFGIHPHAILIPTLSLVAVSWRSGYGGHHHWLMCGSNVNIGSANFLTSLSLSIYLPRIAHIPLSIFAHARSPSRCSFGPQSPSHLVLLASLSHVLSPCLDAPAQRVFPVAERKQIGGMDEKRGMAGEKVT